MLRHIHALAGSAVMAAALAAAPAAHADIFIVIENGGTVTDREAAQETIEYVLGEVSELRRRRATRDSPVHILLTASPTEVSWSGTPQSLYEQGHAVMELIRFRDTCSDLVLAWDQAALTARITMPVDLQLIGIGPLIHAGFPCDENTTISLPQGAPKALKLGELAAQASLIRMLNVHADQDAVYLDYFEGFGVLDRVRSGEASFDLMDAARTRARHGQILDTER